MATRAHVESGALIEVLQRRCPPFARFHLYVPTRAQIPRECVR